MMAPRDAPFVLSLSARDFLSLSEREEPYELEQQRERESVLDLFPREKPAHVRQNFTVVAAFAAHCITSF